MSFIIRVTMSIFARTLNVMKNILILTDFSEKSWNSLIYALKLFQKETCTFYILNATVYQNNKLVDGPEKNTPKTEDNTNKTNEELNNFIDRISHLPLKGKHSVIPILSDKNIINATRDQVKKNNIDLIVVGSDEINLNGNGKQNSLSEEIITKVKCSTLIVPMESNFSGLNEIVFPTDYTNYSEGKLLQNISNLLNNHNSVTRFLYLNKKEIKLDKEQLWNKETLHDYFKELPHSFHSEINKNLEQSIEKIIDEMHSNMIVMAAKNLNFFEQILFRPQLNNIKYFTNTPILALH